MTTKTKGKNPNAAAKTKGDDAAGLTRRWAECIAHARALHAAMQALEKGPPRERHIDGGDITFLARLAWQVFNGLSMPATSDVTMAEATMAAVIQPAPPRVERHHVEGWGEVLFDVSTGLVVRP